MSETSEKDELNGLIDRSRAGIEQHLIEMGVKDDAAARAVSEQVEFGRGPSGALLMKRGKWIASPVSYQRECAQHILSSLAPEDMKNFRDDDEEDEMWAAAKRRLSEANGSFSRAQLLEQKREAELARTLGDVTDTKDMSLEEIMLRKRQSAPGVY